MFLLFLLIMYVKSVKRYVVDLKIWTILDGWFVECQNQAKIFRRKYFSFIISLQSAAANDSNDPLLADFCVISGDRDHYDYGSSTHICLRVCGKVSVRAWFQSKHLIFELLTLKFFYYSSTFEWLWFFTLNTRDSLVNIFSNLIWTCLVCVVFCLEFFNFFCLYLNKKLPKWLNFIRTTIKMAMVFQLGK
jgi:hypothetical protein